MNVSALTNISVSSEDFSLQNQVGIKLLKNNLEMLETNGEGIRKMMESSVTPNLGQNIDVFV